MKEYKINDQITAKEIRLIFPSGEAKIVSIEEARKAAEFNDLDIVLFNEQSEPVTCKLMDYNKYVFDNKKAEKEQKKLQKQKMVITKEVQFSQGIGDADRNVKIKKIKEFLNDGYKVKVILRMRGRQSAHIDISYNVFNIVLDEIKDLGICEKQPLVEEGYNGKYSNLFMILAPKNKKNK
ncbi:MAG: translation initiation factor IF-3 [Clostridia bacterium]|nr:translation initiation factor IF-3 [Clostridia bacterium]